MEWFNSPLAHHHGSPIHPALACDAPPGQQGHSFCFGSMVAVPVGPEPGSRWSARSEARTNDLEAGEDRWIITAIEPLQL